MDSKNIQRGGAFSIADIDSIRQKILELKHLSKDGIKECLSSVELNTTGSKQKLEGRLIEYITNIKEEEEEKDTIDKKDLETQESEVSLEFEEVTDDTYYDLYKKVNYTEYCQKFRMNYDLRRFRVGGQGSITAVERACSYYYRKQTEYQDKVINLLINGEEAYEVAQDYFEDVSPEKINKKHIYSTIEKYEEALGYFDKFLSYTNFSLRNFFTFEFHKILPNYEVVNKLLRALGSVNIASRRTRRAWTKQKIIEINAIIFTLKKRSSLMKGTKKKGVFSSLTRKKNIEGYHNKILSAEAIKYEDMFKNVEIWAKPTSVYDGDTLTVNILFPPKGDHFIDDERVGKFVTSLKVRCNGYDTPEMKGKTPLEKKCALISKIAFIRKINFVDKNSSENGLILLNLSGLDKYGRALGTVYVVEGNKKVDVNQFMIDNNYGYPYSGATKLAEDFLKKQGKNILKKKPELNFSKEEDKKYNSIK